MHYRNYFGHSVPTMVALSEVTQHLFGNLPAEFTKKDFDAVRKSYIDRKEHPMSFQTCRDYELLIVVRTEPTTYYKEEEVWTNPVTGQQFNYDELRENWSRKLAKEFGAPWNEGYVYPYSIPGCSYEEVEKTGYRNIYAVNTEKIKTFF